MSEYDQQRMVNRLDNIIEKLGGEYGQGRLATIETTVYQLTYETSQIKSILAGILATLERMEELNINQAVKEVQKEYASDLG